ncbi:hypothetical protein V8B97DRAFT_2008581 [Scleroderma yunnanense]
MSISLEALEEKFREVEEASERQALDQSLSSDVDDLLCHSPYASSSHRPNLRKCASVSILGQSHPNQAGRSSSMSTPSPLRRASSKSTFSPTLGSVTWMPKYFQPFISGDDNHNIREGDQHVIEIQRLAGRQTFPKTVETLLPRRLSRTLTRSQSLFVTSNTTVVIGVSIERTTTESPGTHPSEQCSTVHAPKARRARAYTIDIPPPSHSGGNLVQRTKEFARRMRRKKQG